MGKPNYKSNYLSIVCKLSDAKRTTGIANPILRYSNIGRVCFIGNIRYFWSYAMSKKNQGKSSASAIDIEAIKAEEKRIAAKRETAISQVQNSCATIVAQLNSLLNNEKMMTNAVEQRHILQSMSSFIKSHMSFLSGGKERKLNEKSQETWTVFMSKNEKDGENLSHEELQIVDAISKWDKKIPLPAEFILFLYKMNGNSVGGALPAFERRTSQYENKQGNVIPESHKRFTFFATTSGHFYMEVENLLKKPKERKILSVENLYGEFGVIAEDEKVVQ